MIGSAVVSVLLGVTVILAFALTISRLAYKARAASRHVLLVTAFAALLGFPTASLLVPTREVALPISASAREMSPPVEDHETGHAAAPALTTTYRSPAAPTEWPTLGLSPT